MARISDKSKYPQDVSVSIEDYLIGTDADDNMKTVTFTVESLVDLVTKIQGYTFDTLPTTPAIGDIAYITDASSVAYRSVATGGGSNTAIVFYDGTNWLYH